MMPNEPHSWRHKLPVALMLLWLAGIGLRLTILAVPPVLAMIRDDFALSATEVGLLSSIPPALFAIAALAGSLLVARLGVTTALVGGLLLVATGSALRGLATDFAILFATTMCVGWHSDQQPIAGSGSIWTLSRIGPARVYTNDSSARSFRCC
jgi:CP family cyanate transporter-like MFS transporter